MSRSPTPPLHLIHMSICLLSMPLSEDYWCPAFDIWHIMCHNVSSNELTQWRRGRKKTKTGCRQFPESLTIPFFFCVFVLTNIVACEYYGFAGEVLSDLCRTLRGVIWCVSPHVPSTQVILNLTLGGWAHNPADIKFCYFKMQGQSNFLFVVLNLSLRGDDRYKCCAFIKYTPDIRLYCHVFVQLWSGKWLTWLIVLTKFPSSWFDTEPLNNPEFLH